MKPSVQKIINKLPKEKVDLATQKVDLSIINKVKQMSKKLDKGVEDLQLRLQDIKEAKAFLQRDINKLDSLHKLGRKLYFQYVDALQDLGFEGENSTAIKLFNDTEKLQSKLLEAEKLL